MYHVYVIKNTQGNIYIGQTNDLDKRLARHNSVLPTKIKSYTHKFGGIWTLVYQENYLTRVGAMEREKYLKSYRGRQFIKAKVKACKLVDPPRNGAGS